MDLLRAARFGRRRRHIRVRRGGKDGMRKDPPEHNEALTAVPGSFP